MDARFVLLIPIALGAGVITAISPCVFPVLPILFAGGGILLGASLGLVFVPCGGPVIGAISANAARLHFGWETVVITVAYALGAAIPMLAIAALGQRVTTRIRGNALQLRRAFGVVMA